MLRGEDSYYFSLLSKSVSIPRMQSYYHIRHIRGHIEVNEIILTTLANTRHCQKCTENASVSKQLQLCPINLLAITK